MDNDQNSRANDVVFRFKVDIYILDPSTFRIDVDITPSSASRQRTGHTHSRAPRAPNPTLSTPRSSIPLIASFPQPPNLALPTRSAARHSAHLLPTLGTSHLALCTSHLKSQLAAPNSPLAPLWSPDSSPCPPPGSMACQRRPPLSRAQQPPHHHVPSERPRPMRHDTQALLLLLAATAAGQRADDTRFPSDQLRPYVRTVCRVVSCRGWGILGTDSIRSS